MASFAGFSKNFFSSVSLEQRKGCDKKYGCTKKVFCRQGSFVNITHTSKYYLVFMFPGNSEWQLLTSIEDIVEESLPNKKLADHFQEPDGATLCILKKKAF